MAKKKPKHKVKGRRKIAEGKPRREVKMEREGTAESLTDEEIIAAQKLLARIREKIVEGKPRSEIVDVKIAEGKPRSEIVDVKIAEGKPKREVKPKREIVEGKPKREVKREREIVKEKPKREIKPRSEIVEEKLKIMPTVVEEKPKREVKPRLEIVEEKPKIMPTVVEEKLRREVKPRREIVEEKLKIMPTGISSLDGPIGGGFPAGSLVVLMGEIGSGYDEFAMTSSVMLAATKAGRLSRPPGKNIMLPEEIWWVTFTRQQSDLMGEIAPSFDSDLYELFCKQANFKDLSGDYFATSSVPLDWVSQKLVGKGRQEMFVTVGRMLAEVYGLSERPNLKPKGLLNSLADFLTERGQNNVVILHTLTDLAMLYSESEASWYEFMIFLRGLQRAAKKWGGIIYTSLDTNLLERRMEQEIAACADGVLTFEWVQAGPAERRRTLYIKKFRRLTSPSGGGAMRFNVNLTSSIGLQVVKPELIEGLKV